MHWTAFKDLVRRSNRFAAKSIVSSRQGRARATRVYCDCAHRRDRCLLVCSLDGNFPADRIRRLWLRPGPIDRDGSLWPSMPFSEYLGKSRGGSRGTPRQWLVLASQSLVRRRIRIRRSRLPLGALAWLELIVEGSLELRFTMYQLEIVHALKTR